MRRSGFEFPVCFLRLRAWVVLVCMLWVSVAFGDPLLEQLILVTPSDPDGVDLTVQAMKEVLENEGLVRSVQIQHFTGAGLSDLSSFVKPGVGDGHTLLVAGTSLVGEAVSNAAVRELNTLVPVAQLTSDADVVVVPASSPYRDMDELLEAIRQQPDAIRWVGEWVGGSDHPTIWQLARAAGVLPELMRYESFRRARDVAAQLHTGQFVAGIAGYTVFDPLIRSGAVRGLGIVSRQPLGGVTIPTFRQLGIVGVSMTNWCGAFAPPSSSDEDRVRLADTIKQMVQSPRWAATLNRLHLRNVYLANPGFAQLIQEEQKRLSKAQRTPEAGKYLRYASMLWEHLMQWALGLVGTIAALTAALYWQKSSARRREEALQAALRSLSEEVQLRAQRELERSRDIAAVRLGMNAQIEREFDRWGLTPAERSIAHLMLKGLRLKGIAEARNTSDRTVRQQAQAIYRKAGLDGRTDLAAYFLETVLGEPEVEPVGAPVSQLRPLRQLSSPQQLITSSRGRNAHHQHLRFPAT